MCRLLNVLRLRATVRAPLGWFVAATLLTMACGSSHRPIEASSAPANLPQVEPSGLHVVTVARATPNLVQLSLWIDAGTRDANPPQLATVSAWAAAARSGTNVHARVLPDGTEFSIECAADETRACVERLAQVLSTRSVDAPTVTKLIARLAQQRAEAELDGRVLAERHALEAALGPAASAFLPWGELVNDTRVSVESIGAFLADHFGPERALLVVAGDIRAALLQNGINAEFSHLPRARRPRDTRALDLEDAGTTVRMERASSGWVAIAVAGHDRADVVRSLGALSGIWGGSTSARWMAVRGGAVAVASMATGSPTEPVRSALLALTEPRAVAGGSNLGAPRDDLVALSQQAGLKFCAPDTEPPTATTLRAGLAATLADEARGGPGNESRNDARALNTQQELQRLVVEISRAPSVRGQIGEQAANVVLQNGARLVVQRRDSHSVGIAIRFLARTSEETPATHGRIALLSLLSSQACEGIGAGALSVRLRMLGASLHPTLDRGGYGLQITAPKDRWRETLELVSHCALRPLLNRRVFRDAQARLLEELDPRSPHGRSASVAAQLTPSRPGAVAPWGSTTTSLLDLDAVVRLHREVAVGARVALSVVGDVPVADVVSAAARPLARLVPGALAHSAAPTPVAPGVAALAGEESPAALIAFRLDGPDLDTTGARAFAAVLGHALGQQPSIQVTWLDGGAWNHGAWAAVAVALPLETLETLDATVRSALQAMSAAEGGLEVEQVVTHAIRRQVRMLAEPIHEAQSLVTRALDGGDMAVERTRAMRTLETFLQTSPHYLVSRGRPAANATPAASSRP